MKQSHIYIAIVTAAFLGFAVVFDTFPRSVFSELEKRELAAFPEYSQEKLADGSFTAAISTWFSDSEPYRDRFMELSMYIKKSLRICASENNITFHASTDFRPAGDGDDDGESPDDAQENLQSGMNADDIDAYENNLTADENAKIANAGIIVVGSGDKVRALMAYGGGPKSGGRYAEAANIYKRRLGDGVNVYCMVIPTATEFYCPDKARSCTNRQLPTIKNVYAHLSDSVKAVDIYTALGEHADEDIYLRTDHHWAPLGAYYAAQAFAKAAEVPFMTLDRYDRRVVGRYVGSMYGYSKDISIKNAPEDFVYYVPRDVTYKTTYINYTVDENYHVTSESKPVNGAFFMHYRDGNGGAYCTFMGGDTKITQVRTSTKNGRRLMILKDSFGNALPGYMFGSFEEVHVIDSRYFTKNMVQYVRENKITDILFANNIFNVCSPKIGRKYVSFLDQTPGIRYHQADTTKTVPAPADGSPADGNHDSGISSDAPRTSGTPETATGQNTEEIHPDSVIQ